MKVHLTTLYKIITKSILKISSVTYTKVLKPSLRHFQDNYNSISKVLRSLSGGNDYIGPLLTHSFYPGGTSSVSSSPSWASSRLGAAPASMTPKVVS